MLEFRALGPIEVVRDGQPVELAKGTERALLAVLVLEAGRAVPADELIAALWDEHPPATAREMVRNYIGRLRTRLGTEVLVTAPSGYRLVADSTQVDIAQFKRLVAEGTEALDGGDRERASRAFRGALSLWRARPLPELDEARRYAARLRELEELQLRVEEDRVDTELGLGRSAALVPELETLVEENPYRERLLGQLMVALYRSGRQKDALDRYMAARRRLVDELGLEPSVELRALQERIIRQDPELDQPVWVAAAPGRRLPIGRQRGLTVILGAAALVLIAVVALSNGGANAVTVPAHGVVALQPSSAKVVGATALHVQPGPLVVDGDHAWVGSAQDGAVVEVSKRVTGDSPRVDTPASPFALAASGGSVWVGDGYLGVVSRIDTRTRRVTTFRPEPHSRGRLPLTVGGRRLWVASQDGSLTEVDPASGHAVRTFPGIGDAESIAVSDGAVWIGAATSDVVKRFDPATGRVVHTIPVGGRPTEVAAGDGAIWVLTPAEARLWRIDPRNNAVTLALALPEGTTSLATAPGTVWAGSDGGLLTVVDTNTATISRTASLGRRIDALASGDGRIWAAVG